MDFDTYGFGAFVIVAVMALVTLATRWGGVYVMSYVPINDRVKQFIKAMSGSVLVAVISPLVITGDSAAKAALLTTAILMLLLKKPIPAITGGILVAALIRNLGIN